MEKRKVTVGKVTKGFIAVVALIVLLNVVYFAFNWNVIAGVVASVATVIYLPVAWRWVKSNKSNRWW